jgi:hypothetical protein
MAGQHTENLFRRFKGEKVTINTISGVTYEGRIVEITNDYVCIGEGRDNQLVFILFDAVESVVTPKANE